MKRHSATTRFTLGCLCWAGSLLGGCVSYPREQRVTRDYYSAPPPMMPVQPTGQVAGASDPFPPNSVPAQLPPAPVTAGYKPAEAMQLPAPGPSGMLPAGAQAAAQLNVGADCLPPMEPWRAKLEGQVTHLIARTAELETQLQATQTSMQSVNADLQASRAEVARLNQNLVTWQDRVRKMDSDLRAQQEKDIAALDDLSQALDELVRKNSISMGERKR